MPNDVKGVLIVPKHSIRNFKANHVYEVLEVIDLGFGTPIFVTYNDWGAKDMIPLLDPYFDIYYQL